ncbi:peptidylprolyl isomerase [Myxococcota bacterium]|nr:peptidylprolyl isomerase [Myxococcota bacterium]
MSLLARLLLLMMLLMAAGPRSALAQIAGCVPDVSGAIAYRADTTQGSIYFELYPNTAPNTVANFQAYLAAGAYDRTIFHRSVPGFVVQGGGFTSGDSDYASIPQLPSLDNEPCLSNTRGTLAMARLGGQPDSATNQWFINLDDNLILDTTDGEGFTAFGRVVFGMEVADQIAALPRFDSLWILELPFNQVFEELPVETLPADPPAGNGCTRYGPLYGLYNPAAGPPHWQDEDLNRSNSSYSYFVPILMDPICTGVGGTPTVPCTPGTGRIAVQLPIDWNNPIGYSMSCEAVAESEASWAARRADWKQQLLDGDVEVTDVIALPEPTRHLSLAAGVMFLAALQRWRHRSRTGP